jgi:type VI secretion system protein ImpL
VGRILNGKDAGAIGGSHMVAGAFTREAWDQYFDKAIDDASKGEIKSDDWVLATSTQESLGQAEDIKRNRAEIEKLYRADYAREWKKFLQGVTVQEFADLDSAVKGLTPLADPENSPTRIILARAAKETSWDTPSELKRSMENAKVSVLERTEKLLGNADGSKAANQYGEVGAQFAYLSRLMTAAPGAPAPINGYFELLGKLKGKMAQVASADEPGVAARQLMQATLNSSGSELHEALQYVDNTLLVGVPDDAKESLRPLLVRPLMQSFATLVNPVEREINRAWAQEVYGQWSNLASKYPFADSTNEATMADIAKFLKPGEGVLSKFMEKNLNGLVTQRGDGYVSRTWAGMGVRLNPAFLNSVSRLMSVSSGLLQEGEGARFELQPIPSPGISEILVEIDGQVMRYRNGPQPWIPFSWPNTNGAQGARIQVVYFNGTTVPVATFSGRLGLMRLLSQGNVDNPSAPTAQVEWRVKKNGGESEVVRVNYRMVSGANPMRLSGLRRQTLPEKVTF